MIHRRATALTLLGAIAINATLSQTPDAVATAVAHAACKPMSCSTLVPTATVDDARTNDCAYANGNQWWLDHVAGSLAWSDAAPREPVVVALFDDGADISHVDLRNRLWTNEAEAAGRSGVDDDGNGYIDDVHGWDFVDEDAQVAPEGECRTRESHGTFMASLIAAERNNGPGIASAGADGARVMALRIVGCGRGNHDRLEPERLRRALTYAVDMGAKILSFSAHWNTSTPELDALFAEIADRPDSQRAAVVVASVPNRGVTAPGYPAAYPFQRVVRAVPIGNDDMISPGTTWVPPGLNLGAPSACVLGATAAPDRFGLRNGSSNSTAILAGLLAGIWSTPAYAGLTADEFLKRVVAERMLQSSRRSKPGTWPSYANGIPLADACLLATSEQAARVCNTIQPK